MISFLCAFAIFGLFCGFAVADSNTRLTGLRENSAFFTLEQADTLLWDVQFLGLEKQVSLSAINTVAGYGQRLFYFVPAPLRLLVRLFG